MLILLLISILSLAYGVRCYILINRRIKLLKESLKRVKME